MPRMKSNAKTTGPRNSTYPPTLDHPKAKDNIINVIGNKQNFKSLAYTVIKVSGFPVPAGMSLTKLSLAGMRESPLSFFYRLPAFILLSSFSFVHSIFLPVSLVDKTDRVGHQQSFSWIYIKTHSIFLPLHKCIHFLPLYWANIHHFCSLSLYTTEVIGQFDGFLDKTLFPSPGGDRDK